MNDHDIAQLNELSTLAGASVQRALNARQEVTPLSTEQTDLVGGGLGALPSPSYFARPPIWYGMKLPMLNLNLNIRY